MTRRICVESISGTILYMKVVLLDNFRIRKMRNSMLNKIRLVNK